MRNARQLPLGQPAPASPHGVSVSLTTLDDLIGYEERRPEVLGAMRGGYPRFVHHPLVARAEAFLRQHLRLGGLVASVRSPAQAARLAAFAGVPDAPCHTLGGISVVSLPETPEIAERVRLFRQHSGFAPSSRQAEAFLLAMGELSTSDVFPETRLELPAAQQAIRRALEPLLDGPDTPWHLTPTGMSAFYYALLAMRAAQAAKGRTIYLQLGWLYLDTQRILEKCLESGETRIVISDVRDRNSIEAVFAQHGSQIAAVVTELPTNPLIQLADVPWLAQLCRQHGALLCLDPSLLGVANANVLPHCDVLVTSLTKYAAHEGDVVCGLVAVNPESPEAATLSRALAACVEPPFEGDICRLGVEIVEMPNVVAAINANSRAVAAFLEKHPRVRRVFRTDSADQGEAFAAIARTPESVGSVISFELVGDLQPFYDALPLPIIKGPSFGTTFSLICPFLYLAHYDLVSKPEGREFLRAHGLDPNLLRLSVGTEPLDEILEALETGLRA